MAKVFYDQESLNDDFSNKLKEHSKVFYSKKWDAYLIKEEDYYSVFEELEFDKQCEIHTEDLLDWENVKLMSLNEMIDIRYEQEYVTTLNKDYDYLSVAYIHEENEEVINNLCSADDWAEAIEETIKVQMAAHISSELSDEINDLKSKGFDIVLY